MFVMEVDKRFEDDKYYRIINSKVTQINNNKEYQVGFQSSDYSTTIVKGIHLNNTRIRSEVLYSNSRCQLCQTVTKIVLFVYEYEVDTWLVSLICPECADSLLEGFNE
jgi:hypothetical protein